MSRKPAPILFALLLALATMLVAPHGASAARAKASSQDKGFVTKLGKAQGLGRRGSCAKQQVAARRARLNTERGRLNPRQRRRLARIAQGCRRTATESRGPASSLYWGGWVGSQLTGDEAPWDMSAVAEFEAMAGKSLSIVNFSSPFANCSGSKCSYYDFPVEPMDNVREHGAIPFFSWASQSLPATLSQPDFQLSDVISGAHDAYIREFAEQARDWGHPFFLRFNWEMNGGWFAWAEGVNGNQRGEFVAAWRHVHDIFAEVGATNATWVWCPNVDPENNLQDLDALYPGDEYVDWTGLDGYNWGTHPARSDKWRSFGDLYGATYREIVGRIAPSKPLIVSEVGSTEHGGSKAAWIKDMLATVPVDFPQIRGLLWFEKFDDGMDWPIETSSGAVSAFAEGIQAPSYKTNSYAGLGPGPIAPPS